MGMFTQRPEDKGAWAALPGEPSESDAADELPPGQIDPLSIGLGASVESIVFPVAPPVPEAADHSDGAPPAP
ncbi:hypothetical protein OED01_14840 [Microbacterium sp. M28]|uniref:hypothetical protein n=1 Tax=Microbacterium sp. M28 TaxID=2962064 RepID=UPI0021F47E9A|nr:hypothetical protein [Microbacterium sp. M28]UYO96858.1 hypothetical protein OED01_14840 [Microbacterium sp. M28]